MKQLTFLSFFFFFFLVLYLQAQVSVENLKCENKYQPLGLDAEQPRFSWQLSSNERGVTQSAYEIQIAIDENFKDIVWNSGKKLSPQSVYVKYAGSKLASNSTYYWKVRVWDNQNKKSQWSSINYFHIGYLSQENWKADWIANESRLDSFSSPYFRKEFIIKKKIKSAYAYVSSLGIYEAWMNGERIGNAYFTPGWTNYNKRIQYQVYDVSKSLKTGTNTIGAILGNGWFKGKIVNKGLYTKHYSNELCLIAQLEIEFADGTSQTIISDKSWETSKGPVKYADIFNGETYDARDELKGWDTAEYDNSDWKPVTVTKIEKKNLTATVNELVQKHEAISPVAVIDSPNGEKILDFGQNLVGFVQMKVNGNKGDTVKIYHAEVLDKDGNFYVENLRSAKQLTTYILKGNNEEIFEPHFTWQGFRYIKVDRYPGKFEPENFKAIVLHSAMTPAGSFSCSDSLLNKLQQNIRWGQRGNFVDVPTDCPQRDERLGWTADAQVFASTAAFNYNVHNFFHKWLNDLYSEQHENGNIPVVIPKTSERLSGCPGWSDAVTIIPWTMYQSYADTQIIAEAYPAMKKWVDFITKGSENNLYKPRWSFGDWLFYSPDDDRSGKAAVTDRNLIAQCFYANSLQILINSAEILNNQTDLKKYSSLLKDVKNAYLKEYVTPNGKIVTPTQTAYLLALHFDMLPDDIREQAAKRLVENIQSYGHLTTGFMGTSYLCHVLSRFGYTDVAYDLLLRKEYPSWLYPVTMGATTIWERWDGIKPDSTFQNAKMNSFNHYAYGAVGSWMYKNIGGLNADEENPGYKHIIIKPELGGGLSWAKTELDTYYGPISSIWEKSDEAVTLNIKIPPNTEAKVYVPCPNEKQISVKEGKTLLINKDEISDNSQYIKFQERIDNYVVFNVGSGSYHFEVY